MSGAAKSVHRVMVIEDDPDFQEFIRAILAAEFEVRVHSSVEDALPELEDGGYRLVVSDINLFGMTGFELLARMKQSGLLEKCPVILCSIQFDTETHEKAHALGAAGLIAKPYESEALLAAVHGVLGDAAA
jgi:DNA-binding response OmpR family regulator